MQTDTVRSVRHTHTAWTLTQWGLSDIHTLYAHWQIEVCETLTQTHRQAELQIVFRYHGPNDPWLCKMMGQFSKGWVNDSLKCTHLNPSLYLWKTLLTKSAVAGFQLWVSSLAAFCLANRRFSLLWDKEVDVRWLVLVLGYQLITCSDARQGSRSLPSTVSYVLHTQQCCCLVPFLVSILFLWRASLAHTP